MPLWNELNVVVVFFTFSLSWNANQFINHNSFVLFHFKLVCICCFMDFIYFLDICAVKSKARLISFEKKPKIGTSLLNKCNGNTSSQFPYWKGKREKLDWEISAYAFFFVFFPFLVFETKSFRGKPLIRALNVLRKKIKNYFQSLVTITQE